MNITTTIDTTSARITMRGDIDFDTLPSLRAAADALPAHVTDLLWDLNHTPFMDIAGLHLLFTPTPHDGPNRRATVTGLRGQPLRLLLLAADLHPATFDLTRLLSDAPPTASHQAASERPL
ncbi:STAS domain-containing protein [Streptomyces griseus]|uniref:STAS domain-containing protein n=1 Tax=Streptomyces griseus TaxID=1911 RepID=UPI00056007D4|nr:STAS domain-containing protein [Streptomyces griseus]